MVCFDLKKIKKTELAVTELSKVWNPLVSWTNFVWENGGSFIYKNSVSFVAGISHISRNKRETLQSYKNVIEYNENQKYSRLR